MKFIITPNFEILYAPGKIDGSAVNYSIIISSEYNKILKAMEKCVDSVLPV